MDGLLPKIPECGSDLPVFRYLQKNLLFLEKEVQSLSFRILRRTKPATQKNQIVEGFQQLGISHSQPEVSISSLWQRKTESHLRRLYSEPVSAWKIQRVIEKHQIYYHPLKTQKLREKRRRNQSKKRITKLKKELRQGFLIQLDTIVVFWNGLKRYILTGIDHIFQNRLC